MGNKLPTTLIAIGKCMTCNQFRYYMKQNTDNVKYRIDLVTIREITNDWESHMINRHDR